MAAGGCARVGVGDNRVGAPLAPPDPLLEGFDRDRATRERVRLATDPRRVIAEAIEHVAKHRGWKISAQNVRTDHVHIVISAGTATPEKVWTRHGSTRYLNTAESFRRAVLYVRDEQAGARFIKRGKGQGSGAP